MWIGATEVMARPAWAFSTDRRRAKRGVTVAIKKKLKSRNAVEPVIGHMKADGRLARNFLKGKGDAMNALLCGAGHNLRKILRRGRFCAPKFSNTSNIKQAQMTINSRATC